MGICLRYTKHREEAEDCLQESFVKIFLHIKSFNNQGSFEGWARKITINVLIAYLKKEKKFWNSFQIDTLENTNHDNICISLGNLILDDLLSMVNRLPDGKRTVFNLYVIEGYSHKEIADLLGIKEGTSKSQLAKAKELLVHLHKKNNALPNVSS